MAGGSEGVPKLKKKSDNGVPPAKLHPSEEVVKSGLTVNELCHIYPYDQGRATNSEAPPVGALLENTKTTDGARYDIPRCQKSCFSVLLRMLDPNSTSVGPGEGVMAWYGLCGRRSATPKRRHSGCNTAKNKGNPV